ncbi:hypothetical protein KQI38_05685 [Tissierella carlieri]|jgi:hypothetical protein|uniref:Uncharacterized protein n=1 Tax=Tissierella carlieri TaxID=689904 RepID=A0ABT1S946_9FIRM|nr:hypothetical protein [Tissierella carlieri]MBU5311513.1 hypothetical protein [Tissierella carlieri]MCQ4923001.1 hypothetical protein [Tissierella carlieri]MDU5081954.1 hypothetical protein [Bacillota bacterium]
MKKSFFISLLILCLLVANTVVFATENKTNVGLSTIKPYESEITISGTKVPTSTWNIATEGIYEFAGQAAYETLYTEYLITGKTSYDISVYNKKGYLDYLNIEVFKKKFGFDESLKTQSIQGQTTKNFSVSNLKTSDKIYIAFYVPVHANGSIK